MLKVVKFGGSSLANAAQFKKVKAIIESDDTRRAVVVSALGKRNKSDAKITDMLYLTHAHLKYSVDPSPVWNIIRDRYVEVKEELGLSLDIAKELDDFKATFSKSTPEDFLVSRGEYYTARLMAEYLGFKFVDAKDVVKFKFDGTIDSEKTDEAIQKVIEPGEKVVIPGFYGAYPNGEIKLLSRGGSDITGSLIARGLKATIYENWTDVSGVLIADPRIVDNPKGVNQITYDELRELSYMGASVLHEETVFPVKMMSIPINIRNTNRPDDKGTFIQETCDDESQLITGISGKKNYMSITITKDYGVPKIKVVRPVLDIMAKYHINVEHIPTSIDTFTLVVPSEQIEGVLYDVIAEIKALPDVDNISLDKDMALIAVVSRNMVSKSGVSGKIFQIVGEAGISIKMIAQGAKEISIIVGVAEKDFNGAINALYQNLVK